MDLFSFFKEKSIQDIEHLSRLNGKPIWIVIVTSFNSQDYYSAKISWCHDGIFDHHGNEVVSTQDIDCLYLCRNMENHKEYLMVQDFLPNHSKPHNFSLLFDDESFADSLINTITITRSQTNKKLQSGIDTIVNQRSFAILENNEYSIFEKISVTDEILINLIPKQ